MGYLGSKELTHLTFFWSMHGYQPLTGNDGKQDPLPRTRRRRRKVRNSEQRTGPEESTRE